MIPYSACPDLSRNPMGEPRAFVILSFIAVFTGT